MYHTIVKGIAKKNFEAVNTRDYEAIVAGCAPNIKHRFGGDHALGGERNDIESLRRWFARLGTVAKGLQLTVTEVWVKGYPWNTWLFIRWTATDTFPDGSPYRNHGVHVINLRWFKAVSIDANEDSQVVERLCKARAAEGCEEAAMPPIIS